LHLCDVSLHCICLRMNNDKPLRRAFNLVFLDVPTATLVTKEHLLHKLSAWASQRQLDNRRNSKSHHTIGQNTIDNAYNMLLDYSDKDY
jgi:hypothetical protein